MSWWDDFDWGGTWDKYGEDIIDAGVTLGAGYLASKEAQEMASAEQQAAQLAWERSQPWNVGGAFGAATFDPETRTGLQTLSPEMQAEYDAAMASAAAQRGEITAFGDPAQAAKTFYEQQKALYAPEQEQQRLSLENRLMAQGMLGSSGGGAQTQALLEAQAQQDAAAQAAAYDKAQGMIDKFRARQASDLAMAQGIGNLPGTYAQTGMGISQGLSGIAGTAAAMEQSAAQGLSDAYAGMWGGAARAFTGYQNPTTK